MSEYNYVGANRLGKYQNFQIMLPGSNRPLIEGEEKYLDGSLCLPDVRLSGVYDFPEL